MSPIRRSAAIAALLLASCHAFEPQGSLGDVQGRVVSLRPNHPLAGVKVYAKQSVVEGWTDRDGLFTLKNLPTKWQDLHIEVEGYRPMVRHIRPAPFGTKYVDIYLLPASEPLPKQEFIFERNDAVWKSDRYGLHQTRVSPESKWQWRTPVWGPDRKSWAALAIDNSPRTSDMPGVWVSDGQNAPMRTASLPATPLGLSWQGGPFLVSLDSTGINQGMDRGMILAMVQRTGAVRFLSNGAGAGQPALSPDGRRIAYTMFSASPADFLGTSRRPGGRTHVVVANAGGADVKELTREGDNLDPAWSPDGRRIAFISNRAGGMDLWVMSSDGTDQQQITFTSAKRAGHPVWSPDGRQIAFNTSHRQDYPNREALELWRADVKSGELTMVSNDAWAASW